MGFGLGSGLRGSAAVKGLRARRLTLTPTLTLALSLAPPLSLTCAPETCMPFLLPAPAKSCPPGTKSGERKGDIGEI